MLIKSLRADLLKIKSIPITFAHLIIPIIMCGLFLAYYSFTGWDENTKILAFFEAIGAGFPVLIGIFTASIMEQEQNAGGCQNLLTSRRKTTAFVSKVILLLGLGLFSIILTSLVFGIGFCKILGYNAVSVTTFIMVALVTWCSSIPLYIWQMFLAFQFGKGISIGVGIVSGLASALMLTNLGTFVWKYIPFSWTGRIPYTFLRTVLGCTEGRNDLIEIIPIFLLVTVVSVVCYLLWAFHWEGSKITE